MRAPRRALVALVVAVAGAGCVGAAPWWCEPWLAYVWWDQPGVYDALGDALPGLHVTEGGVPPGVPFAHPDVEARWHAPALASFHWSEGDRWASIWTPVAPGDPYGVGYHDPVGDRAGLDRFLGLVVDAGEAERAGLADALAADARTGHAGASGYANASLPLRLGEQYDRLLRERGPPTGGMHGGQAAGMGWEGWHFVLVMPYRLVQLVPGDEAAPFVQANPDGRVWLSPIGPVDETRSDVLLGMTRAEARAWADRAFAEHDLPAPTFDGLAAIPHGWCGGAHPPGPVPLPSPGDGAAAGTRP